MLLVEYEAWLLETTDPMALSAANLRSWGLEPRAVGGECRRARAVAGDAMVGQIGGFSHDSEHDLAMMVSDFLENGSSGAESRYSSDSDSGKPDLSYLVDRVLFYKHAVDLYESDLLSAVHSLLVSMDEKILHITHDGQCNASCIRYSLVKLLRISGYDAAVCSSKWQGYGKVPGGDHEYIDVVANGDAMTPERFIIDIDFRSHFEIARAVASYDAILCSLPVVYVGSQPRLKQFLQIMADAAKYSLKQNSMPLPPWRSLAYLQAKWQSKFERKYNQARPEPGAACATAQGPGKIFNFWGLAQRPGAPQWSAVPGRYRGIRRIGFQAEINRLLFFINTSYSNKKAPERRW